MQHRPYRIAAALLVAVVATAWLRGGANAGRIHDELLRSVPANDDTLRVVPPLLRLTFNRQVTLEAARITLAGPAGDLVLRPLRLDADSPAILLADVEGPWLAGRHTVAWQILGADGHPVTGEFAFVVSEDAAGLTPPVVNDEPVLEEDETPVDQPPAFGPESPPYVAVRWLWFGSLIGVLGALTFRLAVLGRLTRAGEPVTRVLPAAASVAARIGAVSALLAFVAAVLRLGAQQMAVGVDTGILVTATTWGRGWMLHTACAVLALAGFVMARRDSRPGWLLVIPAAIGLAVAPALSGHAVAEDPVALNVFADAMHVVGAGGWLGSLLLVLFAGIPVAARAGADGDRVIAAIVRAFSPLALGFAGLVAATGVFRAWQQLGTVSALFSSDYGQALLLKLAALALVVALGAYNFLRIKPSLPSAAASRRLRRSAGLELAMGALVLLLTAVLVATPPPSEEEEHFAVSDVTESAR